jgi:hypothetical protein
MSRKREGRFGVHDAEAAFDATKGDYESQP